MSQSVPKIIIVSIVGTLIALAVSCGASDGLGVETLPPIRTTTSATVTSTTISTDRKFYTVKRGDNLNLIANAFQVPLAALIELNKDTISDPNNVPAGVMLEIPRGIELISDLPVVPTTQS
jgi:LysM repeat protein